MPSDIEIARAAELQPIEDVAERGWASRTRRWSITAGTSPSSTWAGSPGWRDRPDGKLVLVTAINPTPAGEGKTTTTVGLGDGLNRIGKKAVIACASRRSAPASA